MHKSFATSTTLSKRITANTQQIDARTAAIASQPVVLSNPSGIPIVDDVRTMLLERGGRNGYRSIARVLRIMDSNGNRLLDREEFQNGLNAYKLYPTPGQMDELMAYFDRDGSGGISVSEFIEAIRGPLSRRRAALVNQVYDLLDVNSDNIIVFDEVKASFNAAKHPEVLSGAKTEKQVMVEFLQGWEKNGDNRVTREEFLDYYSDIGGAIDDDEYFELMLHNVWNIGVGEDLATTTSRRRVLVTHMNGTQTVEVIKNDVGLGSRDLEGMKEKLRRQGIYTVKHVSPI